MAASNANEVLENIKDTIMAAIAVGMTDLADEAVKHGQGIVSVPIEERPGSFPIRSKVGEPPRLETGRLQDSIGASDVEMGEDKVSVSVYATAPYARHLEEFYKRPFMTGKDGTKQTVEQLIRKDGPKILADAVKREFS